MCTFISVLFLFIFYQYQVGCRKDIGLKNRVFTAQNQYVHKKGLFCFLHLVSYFDCAIEEWGFCTVSISQNTKEELKGFLLSVSSCDIGGLWQDIDFSMRSTVTDCPVHPFLSPSGTPYLSIWLLISIQPQNGCWVKCHIHNCLKVTAKDKSWLGQWERKGKFILDKKAAAGEELRWCLFHSFFHTQ